MPTDWKERFLRHHDFIVDRMSSQFGLIDKLYSRRILTNEAKNQIWAMDTVQGKNRRILENIESPKQHEQLVEALKECDQGHLVNYLKKDEVYTEEFGGDWPLTDREISIIDSNYETLKKTILTDDLNSHLVAQKVINSEQLEFISRKVTSSEKSEALLEILRRSSLSSYQATIGCFRLTNQSHIAEILAAGAIFIDIHANLESDELTISEAETALAAQINSLLVDRNLDESLAVLRKAWRLRLSAASPSHSVALYFLCAQPSDVDRLERWALDGRLRAFVEELSNCLIHTSTGIRVTLKMVTPDVFARGRRMLEAIKEKPSISFKPKSIVDLPLELLNAILLRSFLHSVARTDRAIAHDGDQAVTLLASVNSLWSKRVTKPRFKRNIWTALSSFYKSEFSSYTIHRSNQRFILENVKCTANTTTLKSVDFLSDLESAVRQRSIVAADTKKSLTRLCVECPAALRSFVEVRRQRFFHCLRLTGQTLIAKVVENGGAAVRLTIKVPDVDDRRRYKQNFVNELNCLKDKGQARSSETDTLLNQLKDDDIEILRGTSDRDVVVWIWCKSPDALERLRQLDESSPLVGLFHQIAEEGSSALGQSGRKVINIDDDQLNTEIGFCPSLSADFVARLNFGDEEYQYGMLNGVTKLKNRIYILPQRTGGDSTSDVSSVICVFEAQNPFPMLEKLEFKEIQNPRDIGSSETDNCLYIIDSWVKCIWKIGNMEKDGEERRAVKWLEFVEDFQPWTLSVSSEGHLLMVSEHLPIRLRMYDSKGDLLHSTDLPDDLCYPVHAVQTSTGSFIIFHLIWKQESGWRMGEGIWVVSELSRDGKSVIRQFAPEEVDQRLDIHSSYYEGYLGIDTEGRVLVADTQHDRVILFDSSLRWKEVLVQWKEELNDTERDLERDIDPRSLRRPRRLFYCETTKQLIVGGEKQVNIYSVKIKQKPTKTQQQLQRT